MTVFIAVSLGLFGAVFGSFAGASVWRLRARQLRDDKAAGEKIDAAEFKRLKPLLAAKASNDRSRCLQCGTTLRWFELFPVFSWLAQRGRCRTCHTPIGRFELLMELGTALFFVVSFLFWPFPLETGLEMVRLALWLAAGVVLAVLFAYDAKWYLLPDAMTITLAVLGVVTVLLTVVQSPEPVTVLFSSLGAVAILSGLYLVLYLVSKGQWVGFGDVKLGVGLGLLLIDWQTAFLALFLANLIGCLIVIPLMLVGKLTRTSRVPFGPLLIAGTVVAQLAGPSLLAIYAGMLI